MITAQEARNNFMDHQMKEMHRAIDNVVEMLETISNTIELRSKAGLDSAIFHPYDESRYTSACMMEVAERHFRNMLNHYGYTIRKNNYKENILEISW